MATEYGGDVALQSFSTEQHMILKIAGMICDPSKECMQSLVDYDSINIPLLLGLLSRHGLTMLSLDILRRQVAFGFPEDAFEKLRCASMSQASIVLQRTIRLVDVLSACKEKGLDLALLKGPALALQAYGSDVSRSINDIDLFIKSEDIEACCKVLHFLGYFSQPQLMANEAVEFSRYENELLFVHRTNGAAIDLHWELSRHYLSGEMRWEYFSGRMVSVDIMGKSVRTLSPEDNVVYLSLHGAKHGWSRLEWLCSLGCLIQNYEIDWRLVIGRAEEFKASRLLLLACFLLQEVCGIKPPAVVVDKLREESLIRNLADITRNCWFIAYSGAYPLERRAARYHFLLQDNLLESMKYGLRVIFSPTGEDWQHSQHENAGYWRRCLGRPWRLLLQHFK